MRLKVMMDARITRVWVVEFVYYVNGKKYFKPTEDKGGEYPYFLTRKEAYEQKDLAYHGHHKDLRVMQYMREDCSKVKELEKDRDYWKKKYHEEIALASLVKEQADRHKPPIGESFQHTLGI